MNVTLFRFHHRAHFGVSVSECPVCEKAILGDPGVVRRHLVAFHGGKRNNTAERLTAEEHECQVCLKVFFVRDRRDEHLKNEHHRYVWNQVSTKVEKYRLHNFHPSIPKFECFKYRHSHIG